MKYLQTDIQYMLKIKNNLMEFIGNNKNITKILLKNIERNYKKIHD